MTDEKLSQGLKALYPTPEISSELSARAFQAVTRRHKPRAWPQRLACASAALVLSGSVIVGNRLRLALYFQYAEKLETENASRRARVSRISAPGRPEVTVWENPQQHYSFRESPDFLSERIGTREKVYYKHWNWLIESDIAPAEPQQPILSGLSNTLRQALSPSVHFDSKNLPFRGRVVQEITRSTSAARETFYVDRTQNDVPYKVVYDKPWQAVLYKSVSNPISEDAVRRDFQALLPAAVTTKINREQLRLQIQKGSRTITSVIASGGAWVNPAFKDLAVLRAPVNQQGEVFVLFEGHHSCPTGAIDDQGRRYTTVPSFLHSGSFGGGLSGAQKLVWLIPIDKVTVTRPPQKLTLLYGQRSWDAQSFWTRRNLLSTLPFPTAKCAILPDWIAALEQFPESPEELDRARLVTRGHEAFSDPKTSPVLLKEWIDAVAATRNKEIGIEMATVVWMSRSLAETGDPKESRRVLEVYLKGEGGRDPETLKNAIDTLAYAHDAVAHSPQWAAICLDIWLEYGQSPP